MSQMTEMPDILEIDRSGDLVIVASGMLSSFRSELAKTLGLCAHSWSGSPPLPNCLTRPWVLLEWSRESIGICQSIRRHRHSRDAVITILFDPALEPTMQQADACDADSFLPLPATMELFTEHYAALCERYDDLCRWINMSVGSLKYDSKSQKVTWGEKIIAMSKEDTLLLIDMMKTPDRVFSHDELIRMGSEDGDLITREVINRRISRLRNSLVSSGMADPIRTLRGRGFSLLSGSLQQNSAG